MKKYIIITAVILTCSETTYSQTINLPIATAKNLKNAADSGKACAADMRLRVAEILQLNYLMTAKDSVIRGRGLMIRDLINEKKAEVALKENCEKLNVEYDNQATFYERAYKKERRKQRFLAGSGTVVAGILTTILITK